MVENQALKDDEIFVKPTVPSGQFYVGCLRSSWHYVFRPGFYSFFPLAVSWNTCSVVVATGETFFGVSRKVWSSCISLPGMVLRNCTMV